MKNTTPTYIKTISIKDFRNYSDLSVDLKPGRIILTGDNGSGKTNLLEAISFLSPSKGFRNASYCDVARKAGNGFFHIHAQINSPSGLISVGTGTALRESGEEIIRRTRINQVNAKSPEAFLEWLRILWLTPAMEQLFLGPTLNRRRFLDLLVLTVNTGHARCLLDYQKAMRNRNRLLSDGSRDSNWLESIEIQMAETGTAIAAARIETIKLLSEAIVSLPYGEKFPRACLELSGTLEKMLLSHAAVDVEELFFRSLCEKRERDRTIGSTLEGPHRSDLCVYHTSKNIAAYQASSGEQKALLISIVLAHAKLCSEISGIVPILLFDEIAAHLDAHRRKALFLILEELGCQTLMTGTETSYFSSLQKNAQFLKINQGFIFSDQEN